LAELKEERTANKILIVDTDAIVTQYYCQLYENRVHPIIEEMIRVQNYDMYLVLNNQGVPWVSDGLRQCSTGASRKSAQKLLMDMVEQYLYKQGFSDKVFEVGGNYQERLEQSIKLILRHSHIC